MYLLQGVGLHLTVDELGVGFYLSILGLFVANVCKLYTYNLLLLGTIKDIYYFYFSCNSLNSFLPSDVIIGYIGLL